VKVLGLPSVNRLVRAYWRGNVSGVSVDMRGSVPLARRSPCPGTKRAFDPAATSVPSGTEVTWRNEDPEQHTVTADDGSFDSGAIAPGQSFSVVVDQAGAVTYFCAIHPSMKGTVRVA
jgi:plastocyanin